MYLFYDKIRIWKYRTFSSTSSLPALPLQVMHFLHLVYLSTALLLCRGAAVFFLCWFVYWLRATRWMVIPDNWLRATRWIVSLYLFRATRWIVSSYYVCNSFHSQHTTLWGGIVWFIVIQQTKRIIMFWLRNSCNFNECKCPTFELHKQIRGET